MLLTEYSISESQNPNGGHPELGNCVKSQLRIGMGHKVYKDLTNHILKRYFGIKNYISWDNSASNMFHGSLEATIDVTNNISFYNFI